MMQATLKSRIRGSVLAQALGDALGAPFEFAPVDAVERRTGKIWVAGLYPVEGARGPHGVWGDPAPVGTGTDDVRYNYLFMELSVELRRMPVGRELAQRLLDIYERPGDFFPNSEELVRGQFEMWEGASRGFLGEESPRYPGVPAAALATRSVGLNYPTMAGLLVLPSVGLLFPGDPEAAYRAAYEAAFFDIGYAREATALLAAAQSAALAGKAPDVVVYETLAMDPLHLRGYFGGPFIGEKLPLLLKQAAGKKGEELANFLSSALRHFSVFDPYRALAIACAALLAHADDPWQALLVAANHGDLDEAGTWRRYADIDCYAGITGALIGACCGDRVLPEELIVRVVEGNRVVYSFDLEDTIERFAQLILFLTGSED
jgi:ADP-ribosylglycohydrolase